MVQLYVPAERFDDNTCTSTTLMALVEPAEAEPSWSPIANSDTYMDIATSSPLPSRHVCGSDAYRKLSRRSRSEKGGAPSPISWIDCCSNHLSRGILQQSLAEQFSALFSLFLMFVFYSINFSTHVSS